MTLNHDEFHTRGAAIMRALDADLAHPELRPTNINPTPKINTELLTPEPLHSAHSLLYANLLKILLLTRNGLSKHWATRNLKEYINWCNTEVRAVSTLTLQVAAAIFGGDSNARPFILDTSKPPKEVAWGSAWDLLHVMMMQHSATRRINGENFRPIFVTNDKGLFRIASQYAVRLLGVNNERVEFVGGEVSLNFPHFKDRAAEVREIGKSFLHDQIRRAASGETPSATHLRDIVFDLEAQV